ncbi:MAG: valine--tRNA ligase [Candidatus Cloacimonetes bacterium]|nr:valine--tRNA ligase [Candidatus Cloacimonadota bacterium]
MELNKNYEAINTEKKWYKYWMENEFFKPIDNNSKKPFTILIPPPNVTGILHMGHVLNNTLQDVAIRYHRMLQEPTLWIPGTDHAGIATQNMVEKELAKEGKTRHDIGREELVKKIWEWKNQKGSHIIEQLKQLGASCDWSRERFTMDEGLSKAVKEVFVHLYEKGLIYKGKYIINWCPRCVTALANDEVEYSDSKGKLWYIKYPYEDNSGYLVIATTRPETMLGDVAVAVNPKDERYTHLIGKKVILPIADRPIPVIADDYVDKDFGTGCVKITPAHDPNDFEVGLRHNLDQLIVMDEHGKMNELAGDKLCGKDRFEARKLIIEQLTNEDLIEKIENHDNSVGHCYRCDTVIEPYLSDQWFVKMKPLAEKAIKVVETEEIKFYPERWTKVYMHWMNNIRDWCISRQIWWGHRIPAYYCNNCNQLIVAVEEPTTCPKCHTNQFRQDEDVLDTWFSSWIWPFSTMGWPDKTPELDYYLPTNLLITAPEIIYLWVARMIMSTLEFQNKIPFDTVLLHGIVRDSVGRKMSKSLGNSPDPIDIINSVGADALRFSIIFNTPKGQDSYYSDEILETGRNFCNKIWNAFRFIMMNIENIKGLPTKDNLQLDLADKWIYSRLHQVTDEVNEYYQNLRFNDAAQALMQFVWDDFCSWYLEMAKEKFYNDKQESTLLTTKYVLLDVMQSSMRLLHPIMPFITEEVWQIIKTIYPMNEKALIIANFPIADKSLINDEINYSMNLIQKTITAIRNLRKQVNIPLGKDVNVTLKVTDNKQIKLYLDYQGYISKLAKVNELIVDINIEKPDSSLVAVVEDVQIFLPLSGLVDLEAEKNKLKKQKEKLEKELLIIQNKLKNEKFISNAKPEVIEKERDKENEVSTKLTTINEVIQGL